MTLETIQKVFYGVLSLIGVSGLTWFAKTLLTKIIDHLLDSKLAGLKDVQSREVEKLRTELRHVEDRGMRSNEREFQALTLAWDSFIDAYHATYKAIGGLRIRPNLDRLSDADLASWLETSKLSLADRQYIRESKHRNDALSEIERLEDVNDCGGLLWDARTTLRHQSVFIPKFIEQEFEDGLAVLNRVWAEQRLTLKSRHAPSMDETIRFTGREGEALRERLRDLLRNRLLRDLSVTSGA